MKGSKSVRESLSEEKLQQAEKMILSADNDRLKRLMIAMLEMSYDELDFIAQVLDIMENDNE